MLVGMGLPHMVHVVVTNNTNESIKCVKFAYNSDEIITKLKNIKPNQNKIAGISTIYNVSDLKMTVNEASKEYLIKSEINKGCFNSIEISINHVGESDCEFNMLENDGLHSLMR